MTSQDMIVALVKLGFLAAGLVALVAFVIVPLWRMLRSGPDPDLLNPLSKLPVIEEEQELEIPTGGKKGAPDRSELVRMAKNDPRLTAAVVSRWLKEKK